MSNQNADSQLSQPPYDARVVANFIIHEHLSSARAITQLRLYKLLFFSHGWYLTEFHRPLVWNYFEAWQYGPVIKAVRDCFERFKKTPITSYATIFDFRLGADRNIGHQLTTTDEQFVRAVISAYEPFSAGELSALTHLKGSPWEKLWKATAPVGRFGLRIRDDEILNDFLDVASERPFVYHSWSGEGGACG